MSFVLQSGDFIWASAMIPRRLLLQRNHGNALHGTLVVTLSVSESTTSMAVTFMKTNTKSGLSLRKWSRLSLTVCASSGDPSWNLMPERNVIVQLVLFLV